MKRASVLALVAALAAVAVAAAVYRTTGDSEEQEAAPLTREDLVRLGLRLGPPDPDQPVVPRARAEGVARATAPSPVLGSVLATCYEGEDDVGYPCWAVAHDPKGYVSSGPPGMPRIPAAYYVSIIDSRTGAWIGAQMGGPGGSRALPAGREVARDRVEQAIRQWRRRHVECRDGVRPDFRGRPAFGCEEACYAVIDHNLFRMPCATPRTDTGDLVFRGKASR